MKRTLAAVLFAASCPALAAAQTADTPLITPTATPITSQPAAQSKPVDLAICLDTSGSMDGLIDAARQRLWEIVNDLATARPRPNLRVALLSYGNDGYSTESGWVKVLSPLTSDLDEISNQLFALRTNGGTEFVGRVVAKAAADLDWSKDPGLKLIIVAGNEAADQDTQVTYQKACADAIAKGIMVNAIYCGDGNDSIAPGWRDVAKLADGEFVAIDQNKNEVIPTPHDDALTRLSLELNTTYIPIGRAGEAGRENQERQDANAASAAPAAVAARAQTKAGFLYVQTWDLVDRVNAADERLRVKVEDVKDEELPENMRAMKPAERAAYVASMKAKREEIQNQIADLGKQRTEFLQKEQERRAGAGADTFESALRKAVRSQALKQGFAWDAHK